jgi:hypothetical protein
LLAQIPRHPSSQLKLIVRLHMSSVSLSKSVALMALIYLMLPFGPGLSDETAEMECLKPSHHRTDHSDIRSCQLSIPENYRESCICRNGTNAWAMLYYAFGLPLAFATAAFFVMRGQWPVKGAAMNVSIVAGGIVAAVAARIFLNFEFLPSLMWIAITAIVANGLLMLFYLLTYIGMKIGGRKSAI